MAKNDNTQEKITRTRSSKTAKSKKKIIKN
jgi:hypothetical protein